MSESVALPQPGPVLMSMVPITIGVVWMLRIGGPHLEFSWDPKATLQLG